MTTLYTLRKLKRIDICLRQEDLEYNRVKRSQKGLRICQSNYARDVILKISKHIALKDELYTTHPAYENIYGFGDKYQIKALQSNAAFLWCKSAHNFSQLFFNHLRIGMSLYHTEIPRMNLASTAIICTEQTHHQRIHDRQID